MSCPLSRQAGAGFFRRIRFFSLGVLRGLRPQNNIRGSPPVDCDWYGGNRSQPALFVYALLFVLGF